VGCLRSRRRGPEAQPRVYVHHFMDGAHRELLHAPAVARFFDLWQPLNAYLTEFAFHRSLAAGPFATEDADAATFYFVPFYAHMALEARRGNASLHTMLLVELRAGLLASPHFRRSQGRDHMLVVPASRPMTAMFRGVLPLVAGSIWLTVGLGEASPRRAGGGGGSGEDESKGEAEADGSQPNRVAVPHFAPWLKHDDDAVPAARRRRYSVCLQAPPESSGRAADGGRDREARRLQAELFRGFSDFPRALLTRASERLDAATPRLPLPNPRPLPLPRRARSGPRRSAALAAQVVASPFAEPRGSRGETRSSLPPRRRCAPRRGRATAARVALRRVALRRVALRSVALPRGYPYPYSYSYP